MSRLLDKLRGGLAVRSPAKLEPISYQGLILPPRAMRLGSMPEKPDATYVRYAKGSVRLLEQYANARAEDSVVDIGCGPGRLLIGMQARWGSVGSYYGLDVDRDAIDWAREHLADGQHIRFAHLDVRSTRYNPGAGEPATAVSLPIKDVSSDLVVLLSVFSHMFMDEIEVYLGEISRVLRDGGRCLLTLFVEDDVPRDTENPAGYLTRWKGPLHCVRVNREMFEAAARERGFEIIRFEYRRMASRQSLYVLEKA